MSAKSAGRLIPLIGVTAFFLLAGIAMSELTMSQPASTSQDEALRSARWAEFAERRRRQIAEDSRQLRAHAERSLDDALDPIFARFEERIPVFGEWAFRWRTSYVLLREGMRSSALWALDNGPHSVPFGEAVRGSWDDFITANFEAVVLKPAGGAGLLREAHRRWWDRISAAAADAAADNMLVISLYRDQPANPAILSPPPPAQPMLDEDFRPMGQVAERLEMRMARPLAARLVMRPPAAATAAAIGEALSGIGDLTLAGGPLGVIVTVGTVLGFDYLLNRLDESVSRDDFEAELRLAMRQAKEGIRVVWLAKAEEEIASRMRVPLELAATPIGRAGTAP